MKTKKPHTPTLGAWEVNATGRIVVRNTGGSSASEGGMGSGSSNTQEKGDLAKKGDTREKSRTKEKGGSAGKGSSKNENTKGRR